MLRVDGPSYEGVVGVGWVGIMDRSKEKNNYFIGLNSDYMNHSYQHGLDYHYWSSVIAHEVAHNGGYRHPNGYNGTLIEEFDECVFNDRTGNFSEEYSAKEGALPMPSRGGDIEGSPVDLLASP